MKGKVFLLGDNISGDHIISGRYLASGLDTKQLLPHLFEDIRNDFQDSKSHDLLVVAGENFGCGSSREMIITLLKEAGVKCIIAKSFSRNFFRNGINSGIFPIVCNFDFHDGQSVEVDIEKATITVDGLKTIQFTAFPEQIMAYCSEGGLLNYYKNHHVI